LARGKIEAFKIHQCIHIAGENVLVRLDIIKYTRVNINNNIKYISKNIFFLMRKCSYGREKMTKKVQEVEEKFNIYFFLFLDFTFFSFYEHEKKIKRENFSDR